MQGDDKARKVRVSIDQNLKRVYDDVLAEDVPASLLELLRQIEQQGNPGSEPDKH